MGLIQLLIQHRDALGKYKKYGKVVLPFNWWFMIVSPWLLFFVLIIGTVGAVITFGKAGFASLAAIGIFAYLGQRDLLGPIQALYSLFDTQVSLLRASIRLIMGEVDGTWDVDIELREGFK
jgi:hypothetical protein